MEEATAVDDEANDEDDVAMERPTPALKKEKPKDRMIHDQGGTVHFVCLGCKGNSNQYKQYMVTKSYLLGKKLLVPSGDRSL
jgi:hypothetical protein